MTTDINKLSGDAPFGRSFPFQALSCLYGTVIRTRNALYDCGLFSSYRGGRPVISVGGIRAGGTGKTPVALMVGEYLLSQGVSVAFLSRGFGRNDRSLSIVKPGEKAAWEAVGDEPALLHNRLPQTWIGIAASRRRSAAALAKLLPERSVFIMDDGFQHRRLHRNLDIVCVHAGAFNDRLIPAGFLREPHSALKRAHIVLLIGTEEKSYSLKKVRARVMEEYPHLFAAIVFQKKGNWINAGDGRTEAELPVKNPLLVCGIARPERFTAMVRAQNITPCAELIFPDHHRYTTGDFAKSRELYSSGVMTTEKDAVRLSTGAGIPAEKVWYLTVALRFAEGSDENKFHALIDTSSALSTPNGG